MLKMLKENVKGDNSFNTNLSKNYGGDDLRHGITQ